MVQKGDVFRHIYSKQRILILDVLTTERRKLPEIRVYYEVLKTKCGEEPSRATFNSSRIDIFSTEYILAKKSERDYA